MLQTVLSLALLASRPDIIVVTIDTLRYDHVGAYGAVTGATPAIDRLASSGVLVEEAVVQVPLTRPSHASLMTGLLPFQHGIRDNSSPPLAKSVLTMASALRASGYRTAAFIAAFPVSRASGLDAGFDVFDDPFLADAERNERPATEVVNAALAWMRQSDAGAEPRFVWIHLFEPHYPYEPRAPFDTRFKTAPYDGEIATADRELGRFLASFPPSADRVVVVTSDHGEGLGEHGEDEHHLFVYDTTLRVPLVFAGGGLPPRVRVKGQFRSIDLMPTVLELTSTPVPRVTGMSRLQNLRTGGVIPDNESYAESLYGSTFFGYAPVRALRGEGFKYIDLPRAELYRVATDKGELQNLAPARDALAAAMQKRLRALHGEDAKLAPTAAPLDAATQERLQALGYVASAPSKAAPSTSALPDPKDRAAQYRRYSRAVNAALFARRHDDPAGVVKALSPVAADFASHATVQSYLGEALLQQHRFADALPYLSRARDATPTSPRSWGRLAEAMAGNGQPQDALLAVDRGLAVSSSSTELIRLKTALLTRMGRAADARRFLDDASAANPKDAALLAERASLARNAGDLKTADALSAQAIALAPANAGAWLSRGLALASLDRTADAAQAFARVMQLNPKDADGFFYAATIELRNGNGAKALSLLNRARAIDPQRPGLREVTEAAKASTSASPPSTKPAVTAPGTVRLALIRCRTRQEAETARTRVVAGEDFAVVAREMSIDASAARGGDLGAVRPADLAAPLDRVAASLAPGASSAVLETRAGFVILQRPR